MDTLTHGFEGTESPEENAIYNRGITLKEHNIKMANLTKIAKQGFIKMKAIRHDKYTFDGKEQYYNPYTDEWYGNIAPL